MDSLVLCWILTPLSLSLGLIGCFGGSLSFVHINAVADSQGSSISSPVSSVAADGVSTGVITVSLKDSGANPISGKTVSLSSSRKSTDFISPSSGISDSSGQVTFKVSSSSLGTATFSAVDVTDSASVQSTVSLSFVEALVISESPAYDFGTVGVGVGINYSYNHTFSITNTGMATLTQISPASFDSGFSFQGGSYPGFGGNCGTTLQAGASCLMTVTFQPTSSLFYTGALAIGFNVGGSLRSVSQTLMGTGTSNAVLVITDHDPSYYSLYNIPNDLSVFDFGTAGVGTTPVSHVFSITNQGAMPVSGLSPSSFTSLPSLPFSSVPTTTCAGSLSPKSTCTVTISFSPTSLGQARSSFGLQYSNGSTTASVTRSLTGNGTASAFLTIYDYNDNGSGISGGAQYDFGSRGISTATSHTFYIVNSGSVAATGLGAALSGPFASSGGSFPGGSAGTSVSNMNSVNYCSSTLAAGSSCAATVTFTPTSSGLSSGSFLLSYTDGSKAQTSSRGLIGTGTTNALLTISALNNSGGPNTYYDFGYVGLNLPKPATFLVKNVGGAAATLNSAVLTDLTQSPPFTLSLAGTDSSTGSNACALGQVLNTGAACVITVGFNPSLDLHAYTNGVSVSYSDSLGFSGAATQSVKGTGTGLAIISISSCAPGNSCGGGFQFPSGSQTALNQYFYVTNTGTATSYASSFAGSLLSPPFSYTSGSFPGTSTAYNGYSPCISSLGSNLTCIIQVTYTPSAMGFQSTVLTVNFSGGVTTSASLVLSGNN